MARLLALCVMVAAALPARAEGLAAELGGGLGYGSSGYRDATAPTISLGARYALPVFSAGVRALLFAGSEAGNQGGGSRIDPSGFQAWAALAEVTLQTPGPFSAGVRFGAGIGKVISLNCACEEVAPRTGHVAPALLASFFGQGRIADHYRLVLEFAALRFDDLQNTAAPFSAASIGQDAFVAAILLTIQWVAR